MRLINDRESYDANAESHPKQTIYSVNKNFPYGIAKNIIANMATIPPAYPNLSSSVNLDFFIKSSVAYITPKQEKCYILFFRGSNAMVI